MCTKVNSHPASYISKETTLLLPKQNEVPASNSLLMPIPMNSQNSTTIKMIRPPTNNIIFSSITKMKKKLNRPKKTSEILFKKVEQSKDRSESSSTKNGSIQAEKPHSQKTVKVMKKSSNKLQQQSLIKPFEGGCLFEYKFNNNDFLTNCITYYSQTQYQGGSRRH